MFPGTGPLVPPTHDGISTDAGSRQRPESACRMSATSRVDTLIGFGLISANTVGVLFWYHF